MLQISNLAPHFGPECRVWVFIGKRALDATEAAWANEMLVSFTQTWQTHGKAMNASGFVFENHALVIVANEELGIDYFERMNTLVWDNNTWALSTFSPSETRRTVSAATQLLGELM